MKMSAALDVLNSSLELGAPRLIFWCYFVKKKKKKKGKGKDRERVYILVPHNTTVEGQYPRPTK